MSEYSMLVETMECDLYRQLPPRQVLEHCISMTLLDMAADGCDGPALERACGAVWMTSHVRISQYAPLRPYDLLTYRTFPRVIEGNRYIFYVEISRGGETVARFEAAYIPVDKRERRVLRIERVEPVWRTPPRSAESRGLRRMKPDCAFVPCGGDTVRRSDCDVNGHMTSGAYFALACDGVGFWDSETPRFMRRMQVDYASEVRPGTALRYERGEAGGVRYLRGVKPDGTVAFLAGCEF